MSADSVGRLNRGGIALRQPPTAEEMNKKLRDVADMYEKQFLREMVKSMRSTVGESGLVPVSQGEKIYSEQLDEQYVDSWGAKGGVGLADMIHEQLLQKFGEQFGIKAPQEKLKGPVNLQSQNGGMGLGASGVTNAPGFSIRTGDRMANDKAVEVRVQDPTKASREVTPAWSGTLSSIDKNETGQNVLGIDHNNGFTSLMKFDGELTAALRPGPVEAGQPLGVWDSGQGAMSWNLQYRPDSTAE